MSENHKNIWEGKKILQKYVKNTELIKETKVTNIYINYLVKRVC